MLSKEACLERIRELADALKIHGRVLCTSKKLQAAYQFRHKELVDSILALSPNDRAWLEGKNASYVRGLLGNKT